MQTNQTAPTEALAHYSERSFVRHAFAEGADLSLANGVKIKCAMLDLSQSGCRLQSYIDINQYHNLRIKIPNLELQVADIIWKEQYLYGVQFRNKLSVYVFEHLLKTLTHQ